MQFTVQVYNSTSIQQYKYTTVQVYNSTSIQQYKYTRIL